MLPLPGEGIDKDNNQNSNLMWASVHRLIKQASLILAIVFSFIYVLEPLNV